MHVFSNHLCESFHKPNPTQDGTRMLCAVLIPIFFLSWLYLSLRWLIGEHIEQNEDFVILERSYLPIAKCRQFLITGNLVPQHKLRMNFIVITCHLLAVAVAVIVPLF